MLHSHPQMRIHPYLFFCLCSILCLYLWVSLVSTLCVHVITTVSVNVKSSRDVIILCMYLFVYLTLLLV